MGDHTGGVSYRSFYKKIPISGSGIDGGSRGRFFFFPTTEKEEEEEKDCVKGPLRPVPDWLFHLFGVP
jgi:hypothetical protein